MEWMKISRRAPRNQPSSWAPAAQKKSGNGEKCAETRSEAGRLLALDLDQIELAATAGSARHPVRADWCQSNHGAPGMTRPTSPSLSDAFKKNKKNGPICFACKSAR
jgi:hypothetical protein